MAEKLGTLFQLYYRPARALNTILDSGSLGLAILAAALAGFASEKSVGPAVTGLVLVALVFVPACVAIISVWDHLGSVGVVLRRDYSPLLVCTLMCWAAANIPGAVARFLAPQFAIWIQAAAIVFFLVLASIAVRTVFGTGVGKGLVTVMGGAAATAGGYFAYEAFGGALSYFASPFVLIWLYILFRPNLDMVTGLGGGLRSKQNFRRNLDALTVNPRDADAHYQLGLIYQQRRNYIEAIPRFTKAVEIDPSETDAHHQLGCIACGVRRVGDDYRDGFAHVVHLIDGDRVVVARLELRKQPADGDTIHAGFDEVRPYVHADDAGIRTSGVEIDGANGRVCVRASNERGVHRAVQTNIIGVEPSSREEARVLLPAHACTEETLHRALGACRRRPLDASGGSRSRSRGHGSRSSAFRASGYCDIGAARRRENTAG